MANEIPRSSQLEIFTTEQHERLGFLPFVPAIRTRGCDLVFVSGVIGIPRDYHPDSPGPDVPIREEARRVFTQIRETLVLAGASLHDVVRITKYMTNLDQHNEVVEIMREFFGGHLPTSTTIEVNRLVPRGYRLEVDAIAAIPIEGK